MRTVADVSAVADPDTGVAVYDTFGDGGWAVYGGTSASSPIIAGVYAVAGTPVAGTYPSSLPVRGTAPALNDVTDRQQRHLHAGLPVHRRPGLRRPDRSRHPERPRRVHAPARTARSAGTVTDAAHRHAGRRRDGHRRRREPR